MKLILIVAGLVVALAACGERPQSGSTARKIDTKAWEGAQNAFVAPGWKPGDQASWESQMHSRAMGQNEYLRTGPRQ